MGSTLYHRRSARKVCALVAVLTLSMIGSAYAQSPRWAFGTKNLFVGRWQDHIHTGGHKTHVGGTDLGEAFPGWDRYASNFTGGGLWITARDFTDADGTLIPRAIAQIGFRFNGVGHMFPQAMELAYQFEPTAVYVDDEPSFKWPIAPDRIDPNLDATAAIHNVVNSKLGITMTRTIRAFQNEYHDNYHITEYVLTNTGEIEPGRKVPEQTVKEVYLSTMNMNVPNVQGVQMLGWGAGWGHQTMGDALSDDDGLDFPSNRIQYAWQGRDLSLPYNNLGGPAMSDNRSRTPEGDSVGRLASDHFLGYATLHADTGPGNPADDPNQPSWTHYDVWETANAASDALVDLTFETIDAGHQLPTHFDIVVPSEAGKTWADRMANVNADPRLNDSGNGLMRGWGPYSLAPGESVRLVFLAGAAGLSDPAAYEIGRAYKQHYRDGNEDAPISFDANGNGRIDPATEVMSKNYWVATSRDSIFQMVLRADANLKSAYAIPEPPRPPLEFRVYSEPGQIRLKWMHAEGGPPRTGYEVYRNPNMVEGIYGGGYEKVAGVEELGPNATEFVDTEVERGVGYYYYVLAVGETNQDPTGLTPTGAPLRSNRAFTQTYDPAKMKRLPGEDIARFQIVPNPYTLESVSEVRWPDKQDQIAFMDIPGRCTIRIYTELGELVQTIEHTDGSGDEFWDLTTSSRQLVVTGIYLAVVRDHDTGEQTIKKFTIIR